MIHHRKRRFFIVALILAAMLSTAAPCPATDTIGVLYILHGGMDENRDQYMWDASVQMFSYDPNHPVYQMVMWNPLLWSTVLQIEFGTKFIRKFEFEYERIGGSDPFHTLSDLQLADMKAALDNNTSGLTFEVDFASWMSGDRPANYPYPRFIYNVPRLFSGYRPLLGLSKVRYCGEREEDGPWEDCDPKRYDVDGPVERLLAKGASRIIAIDTAVGAVRFYKTYDVVQMTKRALADWNAKHNTSVPIIWVNDYSNLMEDSYPEEPEGWTPFQGPPEKDRHMLVNGRPNPVSSDMELAVLNAEGIEAAMSAAVADNETGVMLFNHGLFDPDRSYFDPKIDDTIVLNENIKALLLERHPTMDPENIVGSWGGVRELNPENGLVERTREMRGEDLAHTGLHDSDQDMPGDEWGYRYWDALEYLKNRGVRHIVIGFPQVMTDSVLTLVELYNQLGKEIGIKTWLTYNEGDYATYPDVGHPFADYWGNWVDTDCSGEECCFTMGGCSDGRPYPPPRQTPLDDKRDDMDPSLAYDLSDYGHLGYDPQQGPPAEDQPVQAQYTGTWQLYITPSDDPRVGQFLAKHVLAAAVNPMVYITNGEVTSASVGTSVTWQAHIAGGPQTETYTYAWFTRSSGSDEWQPAGNAAAAWQWTPAAEDIGTHQVRCRVTDSQGHTDEVTFEDFVVK
ncbi:hypothetical protein ACFL43_05105 [Thermodesulfobacteriota bacterium]